METQTKESQARPDRRAVRSKRLILQALRALVLEKDYKKITVSDIVERADIGRATFYAHFEDKEDLGRFMFGQLMAEIEREIQMSLETDVDGRQNLIPSLALFRIAAEKHRWFKLNALTPGIGLDMLVKPLVSRFETQLDTMALPPSNEKIPKWMMATYLVSALIGLLKEWVMDDMPKSPETMDSIYQALAEPTLTRLLGG